jgi:hypothetical protein
MADLPVTDRQGNPCNPHPIEIIGLRSFVNVTANTTTTAKSGAGRLAGVAVNTKGSGSQAVVSDTGGTVIATIDTSSALGTIVYDCPFVNGLTIVTTGGSPADITVIFQ